VEEVEHIERETCLWPFGRCRKPSSTNELDTPGYGRANTIAEIDIDLMDAIAVKENEIGWPSNRTGTFHASMAKLDP